MPVGRRTKLTPQVQQKIINALTDGNYFEVACQYAGIDARTGLEWLQRGRGEHAVRPQTPLYVQFAQACEKAQADDETMTIARIKQAGQGGVVIARKVTRYDDGRVVTEEQLSKPDWTADAWRQERKHYQRWGRKERVEIRHFIVEEVERISSDFGLTPEEKAALIQDVEAFAHARA